MNLARPKARLDNEIVDVIVDASNNHLIYINNTEHLSVKQSNEYFRQLCQ
jgi:hypothetical protein